jgi:N-acetylmuramic acid 6-phosphate etherase
MQIEPIPIPTTMKSGTCSRRFITQSLNLWAWHPEKSDESPDEATRRFIRQTHFRPLKNSSHKLTATERRNPRSQSLDQMTTPALLKMINREDQLVPRAVEREIPSIERAVDAIAKAIAQGGRLIYVGAGTSGRLAALDAAECPPTFGVSSRLVQAVVAGGRRALTRAAENVEDSAAQGSRDLAARKIGARDIVIGVTASGRTPYVLGALHLARERGTTTVLITSNRNSPASRLANITISPQTGPEVIAGSTRMKAGTAQKLILNMLSTAAMIRLGRVYNNWMVDLSMTNAKLRSRGLRILEQATGASAPEAKRALAQSGNLRIALVMLKTGMSLSESRRWLQRFGTNLSQALAMDSARPHKQSKASRPAKTNPRKKG